MSQKMGKYEVARSCLADAVRLGAEHGLAEDDCIEALIVVAVEAMTKGAGRKRAADVLRYELSSVGGDVDTVFLRSR
jgi:hypothetical protein